MNFSNKILNFTLTYQKIYPYLGEHSTMYLGEGKNPRQKELIKLGEKHNVKDYADIIVEVQHGVNKWHTLAKKLGISGSIREQIAKTIETIGK
ncbi:MAG: Phosphatidylinositol kinase [uncultured Sulfurovum sp.]|uniref:Phosphatidylinositol kinase n=1 Tax=uncultured Sulfurovum sp. TaxID=269237 RepID=A0A6S6U618_9BACT|nr:MAG: Phosphatidylinositol kinase [uncultured Sulfurovum sp.]